eukprot:jgi/Botrbrau1/22428/Bobra.0091s0030.1
MPRTLCMHECCSLGPRTLWSLREVPSRAPCAVHAALRRVGAHRYLDEGGNPDEFTTEVFHRANRGNQLAKGKSDALAAFRDALLKEAREAFPDATEEYLKLRPDLDKPEGPISTSGGGTVPQPSGD